jgi:hypothetical protein
MRNISETFLLWSFLGNFRVSLERSLCMCFVYLPGVIWRGWPRRVKAWVFKKTSLFHTETFLELIDKRLSENPLQFLWILVSHLFVFSPAFGTKEDVKTVHAQVNHHSFELPWLPWWCCPSVITAKICRVLLPFCGDLHKRQLSPCNCREVIGFGIL